MPELGSPALTGVKRTVFRGSVGSDYGKELRWELERRIGAASLRSWFRENTSNVTVRDVLALVMFYSQPRTAQGEAKMAAMTRELIDAALSLGGTYYLPYRPHATREQFRRAYPRAGEFFARTRRYDPGELFQNRFYANYGPPQERRRSPHRPRAPCPRRGVRTAFGDERPLAVLSATPRLCVRPAVFRTR